MARVLAGCHSYTLIRPGAREKITVKRGQSIDHLDPSDKAYLERQTITPPSVDDSHLAPMRTPVFQEVLDEDARGEAQRVAFAEAAATPQAGGRTSEPVSVTVTVAPQAGVTASAKVDEPVADADDDDADDDGDAAGGDEGGGEEPAAEAAPAKAKAAAPRQRRTAAK